MSSISLLFDIIDRVAVGEEGALVYRMLGGSFQKEGFFSMRVHCLYLSCQKNIAL